MSVIAQRSEMLFSTGVPVIDSTKSTFKAFSVAFMRVATEQSPLM